jgi:phospholipase C
MCLLLAINPAAAGGEALIKATYEAIRNSPLWERSLQIITYDEHGGFYDSVQPGGATPPGDGSPNDLSINSGGFLFDWYGVRVPAVIVSPEVSKEVIGTRALLARGPFVCDILHRFLRRVSVGKSTSAPVRF